MMRVFLFVDDERENQYESRKIQMPKENIVTVWAKSYDEAICNLKYFALSPWHDYQVLIDLDHDLGEGKTGYDIAKYIVEKQIPLYGFSCHSMNPVGRKNIEQLLTHYGYKNTCNF